MHDVELAWELAELVHNRLTAIERNNVYIAIGAGDTFTAIEVLLQAVVVRSVALQDELVARLHHWLQGYANDPRGPDLHRILRNTRTAVSDLPLGSPRHGLLPPARRYQRPHPP
jgi:hypothetical protein